MTDARMCLGADAGMPPQRTGAGWSLAGGVLATAQHSTAQQARQQWPQ